MSNDHAGSDSPNLVSIARAIWEAALARVQPAVVVAGAIEVLGRDELVVAGEPVKLRPTARIRLLALGKAADAMARASLDRLGTRIDAGLIVTKDGHASYPPPPRIKVIEAPHPLPDTRSVSAGRRIARFLKGAQPEDLLLVLLSGGASALATWPRPPLNVHDMQRTTDLLLRAGAPIHELNVVRKHLDRLKGGGLLRFTAPARLRVLALSDVVGDDPALIGSGPAVPDPSTFGDAVAILDQRRLLQAVPPAVRALLERGVRGEEPETLKPGDPLAERAITTVIAGGNVALAAAATRAAELGFMPRVLGTGVQGEAREVGRALATEVRAVAGWNPSASRSPMALLWAGETTVSVTGNGLGGRNQELALAAALTLDGVPGVCLAALGTDGTDGPTDAAGAVVDGATAARARSAGVDLDAALGRNDSYRALEELGALIRTGPTGTNVNDIGVALIRHGAE
jgi:glycerate 2-kinase